MARFAPVMIGVVATMACAPVDAASSMRFACSVSGEKLLSPAMAPSAVCARVQTALEAKLGSALRAVPQAPDMRTDRSGWVSVTLRFAKPGIASAKLSVARNNQIKVHPEVSVAVSDRAMGADTVNLLARQLSEMIGSLSKS
jgi:hypothetical protein